MSAATCFGLSFLLYCTVHYDELFLSSMGIHLESQAAAKGPFRLSDKTYTVSET